MRKGLRKEASFKSVIARKDYTCLICDKKITKGTSHLTRQIHSIRIRELVEERSGKSWSWIARRCKLWFADALTLRLCSLQCLQLFKLAEEKEGPGRKRIQEKIKAMEDVLIEKVLDITTVMVKLHGHSD